MVVTSIGPEVGVKRVPTSLHNVGQAADIRISNLPDGKVQQVVAEIAEAIGPEFDVVLEADKGHIHLEWQPKSD